MIAYYRVSTRQQGRSGLGLDAQRAAVEAYARQSGGRIAAAFTEVESGRRDDRPELARALAHARRTGARLVVAKMDRLARNAGFLLALLDGGAEVAFCDFPNIPPGPAGKFLLTQMAAVAELEAGLIAQRTREALAAAKARGTLLGAAREGFWTPERAARRAEGQRKAVAASGEARRRKAVEAYADLLPEITGKPWHAAQVLNVLRRAGR